MPVYHPDEIASVFDSITYGKGSSVLRMLAAYLGEGAVKRALQVLCFDKIYLFFNFEFKKIL